jgi:hypothetical protein
MKYPNRSAPYMKKVLVSALLAGAAMFAASPSEARPYDHHPHVGFHARVHGAFRPHARFVFRHDFRHFTPVEHRWWRGGRWHHMRWHGRWGWWWGVGGAFYWYPAPVYPYPVEVSPTYYDEDADAYDGDYDDSGSGGGYGTWQHCSNPEGYYPYIKECRGGWESVPAQPNDMQSGPGPDDQDDQGPPPNGQYDDEDDQAPSPPPGH